MQTALHLFDTGDHRACADLCREVLAINGHQPQALFLLGLTYHQRGETTTAADHLARALESAPDDPRILYNYSVILLELKRADEACAILSQLATRFPEIPEAHFLLGNALHRCGQPEQAILHYQKTTALRPDYIDAWFNLGLTLREQERYPEAIEALQRILAIDPHHASALLELGSVLHAQGAVEQAIDVHQKLLSAAPDDPTACHNMGVLFRDAGHAAESLPWLEKAACLRPNDSLILNNLGQSLHDVGQFPEASAVLRQAITLNPQYAAAHSNLGRTLYETGCLSEAIAQYQQALALNPQLYEAWYNLGKCRMELLEPAEAIAMYRRAITIKPDLAEAHWNLSHVLLLIGEYEEGFREYLWRWQRKNAPNADIPKPEWQGEVAPGQTLLVHAEQGLGDAIQFVRYLPMVRERVGRLYLACDQALIPLFQSVAGIDAVLGTGKMAALHQAIDLHVPLLNLPALFRTGETTIPAKVPYLHADPKRIDEFAPFFADTSGAFKIGLAWRGNPGHKNDRNRSCRLNDFAPLLSRPGTAWYSLQKEHDESLPLEMVDLAPHLNSFADTAAVMAHLDLVISVDTSVAHLAGALAGRVWTVLPYVPDWRWLLSDETTPWYPTMRLFRQPRRGDWHEVFKQVREALDAYRH
ncbi:MAG: tetratricopeptide repeat protein [Thermodesulfobacteriota bacterium]